MKSYFWAFIIIVFAGCLAQFASDIYAPSVPAIANDLDTPVNLVQFSMAIYMIGMAASQLFYGPISEGIGRKYPLIFGITVMIIASILCIFAPNIKILIAARFLQGIGAGGSSSLWRTIFRDLFSGQALAKYTSYLVILVTFINPAAPVLGGYLQHYFSWQASFIFIVLYAVTVLLIIIIKFDETSQHHHPERLKYAFISATYKKMLTSRLFMGTTACTFMAYGGLFSCITASPVLLIKLLGLTPAQFGWFSFLGGGGAFALSGFVNGRAVTKYGSKNMIYIGQAIMLLAGISMAVGYLIIGIQLWGIIIPIILFYFGSTFIWPNAFSIAFTPFGKIAGYAGALYGFMQICGGGVIGSITSFLPENNPLPLAIILIVATILSFLALNQIVKLNDDQT